VLLGRSMNISNLVKFRIIIMLVTTLLGLQCVWLVSSELARPAVVGLSTNVTAASKAAKEHNRAALAATIGAIRGELWAQSAFSYADLLFGENKESAVTSTKLARASISLEHALRDAPVQPAAWLLRAWLGARYPSLGFNATEALKMSYYTGPSEEELIPLRLRLAVLSGAIGDLEMSPLIRRDLRLLLARKQQAVIADAYSGASPSGKRFIEKALGDIDRSAAESLRKGTQNRSLPD
jgi:hypothetical protein